MQLDFKGETSNEDAYIYSSDRAFTAPMLVTAKFDSQGNEQALSALKSSAAKDHLRVTVTGDREGGTIKVKSLAM